MDAHGDLGPITGPELDDWEPLTDAHDPPLPSRLVQWSRQSVMGAVMTGVGRALGQVYEQRPVDDAIVIEVDANGEPHDLPIRLLLDPDDPRGSLCIVRRDPKPPQV